MVSSIFNSPLVKKLIEIAIEEDLLFGDVTTTLTVKGDRRATGAMVAKEDLVVAGLPLLHVINEVGGGGLSIDLVKAEGDIAKKGETLARFVGGAHQLLSLERTFLNFIQRLSGVATHTRNFVTIAGPSITVLDTRKTMPGWRALDKYSVRVGGAKNHRISLSDMVLVKNNHVDANPGGMREALAKVVTDKPPYMPWEVEVRDLEELKIAVSFNPHCIMLDNFSDAKIAEAMKLIEELSTKPLIEVSGGMSAERAASLGALGVNAVSAGALTTAARNVDISLKLSLLDDRLVGV